MYSDKGSVTTHSSSVEVMKLCTLNTVLTILTTFAVAMTAANTAAAISRAVAKYADQRALGCVGCTTSREATSIHTCSESV